MKIYNEQIALQSQKPREVLNITTRVKAAAEKSAVREGIVLVSALHSGTAIVVNEDAPGLLDDLAEWLAGVASIRQEREHQSQQSGAGAPLQAMFLPHQVVVPITEGRLDLGASEAVLFLELDGLRPRRVVVKIVGE
jgi:secondary thiamine-phosphate synthase enzyme